MCRTSTIPKPQQGQNVALQINGVDLFFATTKPGLAGVQVLPEPETTHTVTWTAPSSAAASMRIGFALPAHPANNDDIRFSLPVFSAPTCT